MGVLWRCGRMNQKVPELKRSLSEVKKALDRAVGKEAMILLEQRMVKNKKDRIIGTIITDLFHGKNNTDRWGLVSEWLDSEDVDQAVIGLLQLYTHAEWEKRKRGKISG